MCLLRRLNLGGDSQRLWPGSRRWGRRGWVLPAYRTSSLGSPAQTLEEAEEEKGPISIRFSRAGGRRWKQPTTGQMSNGNTHDLETVFAQPLARKTSHVTWSPDRRPGLVWIKQGACRSKRAGSVTCLSQDTAECFSLNLRSTISFLK